LGGVLGTATILGRLSRGRVVVPDYRGVSSSRLCRWKLEWGGRTPCSSAATYGGGIQQLPTSYHMLM
jgi:hypothetical protein